MEMNDPPSAFSDTISPSKLKFIKKIHSSESSEIFIVSYDENKLCLKVFHMGDDPGYAHDSRDLCRYRCESHSYERFQAHGVCSQGCVPNFYGLLEDLDPNLFGLHLVEFKDDNTRPCAILLEYLPTAEPLSKDNSRDEFVQMGLEGLKEIYEAGVIHNDAYPKNVLVASGERLVWVDFDVAIVFPAGRKKRGKLRFKDEDEVEMGLFESAAQAMDRYG